jgi:hypothetical protein
MHINKRLFLIKLAISRFGDLKIANHKMETCTR